MYQLSAAIAYCETSKVSAMTKRTKDANKLGESDIPRVKSLRMSCDDSGGLYNHTIATPPRARVRFTALAFSEYLTNSELVYSKNLELLKLFLGGESG